MGDRPTDDAAAAESLAHAIVGLAALGCAGSARAAELTITAQAVAAHGEFLTQAPPPPTQGVLCLVDSGVDVNPDTEPILVGRESIHGGTTDDVTGYHHGTYVAMVAGAAANGWGMVGAWPQLRVLSVRVLPEGSEHLSADAYRAGIFRCVQAKTVRGVDVRAVELALGGPATDRPESELAEIADAVAYARQNGLVVLSAAGNDAGAVNVPASIPGVVAVGATDRAGALCAFSSRGADVDLTAPGCDMDVAMAPNGDPGVGSEHEPRLRIRGRNRRRAALLPAGPLSATDRGSAAWSPRRRRRVPRRRPRCHAR